MKTKLYRDKMMCFRTLNSVFEKVPGQFNSGQMKGLVRHELMEMSSWEIQRL